MPTIEGIKLDTSNVEFNYAVDFVQHTNKLVYLTGKAGTGKTTFLKYIKGNIKKNAVILVPTGVAAINAGGQTIHSFFQIKPSVYVPNDTRLRTKYNLDDTDKSTIYDNFQYNKNKLSIIKGLELLIIEEISMVRCDLLDVIDRLLRVFRKREHDAFGGVQVILIGDTFQLPPIAQEPEWDILKQFYENPFFFSAKVIEENRPVYIELKKIYRQKEQEFIDLLNRVRVNQITPNDINRLNAKFNPVFVPGENENYITLATHNEIVKRTNLTKLEELPSELKLFEATVTGDFPEINMPTDRVLQLKENAQIMFVKNDKGKRYFNGKIAKIIQIDEDGIVAELSENNPLIVERETWENIRYVWNNEKKKVEEEVIGTFTQYPVKLAWSITVHKSQGLTFEKVIADLGSAFAPGQVYVALSRCTTFNGIVLRTRLHGNAIKTAPEVLKFAENEMPDTLIINELNSGKADFYYKKYIQLKEASEKQDDDELVEVENSVSEEIIKVDKVIEIKKIAKGTITWAIYDDGTLVISGNGEMEACYNDYYSPWNYNYTIATVVIENGITSIGTNAFEGCYNLTSITIPESVTSIENSAFWDCRSLTSITIPSSVTNIGDCAFYDCKSLISIDVDNNNTVYTSENGILFDKSKTVLIQYPTSKSDTHYIIPESVVNILDCAFENCSSLTSIIIGNNVASIGNHTFDNCNNLTSIIIGNNVTSIGAWAFYRCNNLTSIIIGNSVTSIGESIFSYCSALNSIIIPSNVTSIGGWAFNGCSGLASITIPESVVSIGDAAFSGCTSLISIDVENDNTAYTSENGILFDKLKKTLIQYPQDKPDANYIIPEGVTNIRGGAFSCCRNLESVTIPDTVLNIEDRTFNTCRSLTSVTIGNNVKNIGDSAFSDCRRLTSITIPDSVTSIENSAFFDCCNLTSVTIGNCVTWIGLGAFSKCTSLKHIKLQCSNPPNIYIAPSHVTYLSDVNKNTCVLHIPVGSKNEYAKAGGWNEFKNIQEDIDKDGTTGNLSWRITEDTLTISGVGAMPDYNCYFRSDGYTDYDPDPPPWDCSFIAVVIENGVTSIGIDAFRKCGLTSITIPESVTSIGNFAFEGCSSLSSVNIPASVKWIGDGAFGDCSSLKHIKIQCVTPPTVYDPFDGVDKDICVLHVPFGCENEYANAEGWKDFKMLYEI